MNIRYLLGGLLLAGLTGCSSMNNTTAGAVGGGAVGAGVGALAGAATGHAGAGAAIGAGVGAITGGLLGNAEDRAEDRQKQAAAAYAASLPKPPTLQDIIALTQSHTSDEIIINQIRQSRAAYSLSAPDIAFLKQNGVSDRVVIEMQSRQAPAAMIVPGQSVYYVESYGPPVAVGVGIGYGYHRRW
jgi:hypothetical protein